MRPLPKWISEIICRSGLQYMPVRVRHGLPKGASWTLYPWTSYWRAIYEPWISDAILSLGDLTGKSCWDLGAHFGYYSIGLARKVGPTGSVAAFEPFPSSFARLERHRQMNDLSWMKALPFAASDEKRQADFFSDTSRGDTGVHLAYDGETKTANTPLIQIQTERLDDLVDRNEIKPPDLIKIDVEGHGHRALSGAHNCIRNKRPVIVMGFHSDHEVEGTLSLLKPLGYRWTALQPDPQGKFVGCDYLLQATA